MLGQDATYCINLDRRPDRWEQFVERCVPVVGHVQRWPAVDGAQHVPPAWFKAQPVNARSGAWGCYLSHLQLLEDCLAENLDSVLIFEDDAVPLPGIEALWAQYRETLPADWQMVYLGGQLRFTHGHPPQPASEHWYVPWDVNRLHAYALRGQGLLQVTEWLRRETWGAGYQVDHHVGALHQSGQLAGLYVPARWLFGQSKGYSDIRQRVKPVEVWECAADSLGRRARP